MVERGGLFAYFDPEVEIVLGCDLEGGEGRPKGSSGVGQWQDLAFGAIYM